MDYTRDMIKAVIFDCFGVLTTDGWLAFCDKYFYEDPALQDKAGDLNKQVDAGLINYGDFLVEIAKLADITPQEVKVGIETNKANDRLFEYIEKSLKPFYKIAMLSNASDNWLNSLFSTSQIDLFDETVFSYQLGVVKPDPLMYQTVIQRLDTEASESIFIDDQPRYVDVANELGLHGVVFKDTKSTIEAVEGLLRA